MNDNRSNLILLPSGRGFNRTHLTFWEPEADGGYTLFFVGGNPAGGQTRLTGDDAVAFVNWLKSVANGAQMTHQPALFGAMRADAE